MAWLRRGRETYETFVRPLMGPRKVRNTGAKTLDAAERVEAWLADVRERGDRLGVLDAIAARTVSLKAAYAMGETRTAAWVAEQREKAADVDLDPMLDRWAEWRRARAKGTASVTRYIKQIRTVFPESPWRRSLMTPAVIGRRLDDLTVKDPTRNRYRAALSAYCKWLVREGVLPMNPARAVDGYSEHRARVTFYSPADAQKVIAALPVAYQGREALMAGTGMDWSDCAALKGQDIDVKAKDVRCHGHKTSWRNRAIKITEPWVLPYVRAAVKGVAPDALVFGGDHSRAIRVHHKAVEKCKLPHSTLHDWRHTYAVNALRRGETAMVVAHQLGHATAYLVWTRYGKFVPNAKDYQAQGAQWP